MILKKQLNYNFFDLFAKNTTILGKAEPIKKQNPATFLSFISKYVPSPIAVSVITVALPQPKKLQYVHFVLMRILMF